MAGLTQEIPRGQDGPISHAWVANKKSGFTLSCPLADKMAVLLSFDPPVGNEIRITILFKCQLSCSTKWNLNLMKGQGNGKICAFVISRIYFIVFTITGLKKIVCYTEDFVI